MVVVNAPECRVCRRCGADLVRCPSVAGLWLSEAEGPGRGVCAGTGELHQAWPRETLAAVEGAGRKVSRRSEPMPGAVPVPGWQPSLFDVDGAA